MTDMPLLKIKASDDVSGRGEFASVSVSDCGGLRTVHRFPTIEAAEHAKSYIDDTGCCGSCLPKGRWHFVARVA